MKIVREFLWTWLKLFALLSVAFGLPLLDPNAFAWSQGWDFILLWLGGGALLASFVVAGLVRLFGVRKAVDHA
jgi:hypothetical protein